MKFESLDQIKSALAQLWAKAFPKPEGEADKPGTEADKPESQNDLAAMTKQFEALEAKVATNDQLTKDLATAKQTIGTLTTEKEQAAKDLAAANAKVLELEATIKDPKGEIARQVRTICAGQGINVDQLPNGKDDGGTSEKAKAEKHYMGLIAAGQSLEAGKYWQKNRELLS